MKKISKKEFWIILSPESKEQLFYMHNDEETAVQEAKRLAQANPGKEFIVFLSIIGYKVDNLTEVTYEEPPF